MKFSGPDPKMLDDLARVAGGAVNVFSGLQEQIRNDVRARMEDMATKLDLVPRDELEQAKGMIAALRTRIDAVEGRLAKLEGGPKKPPAKAKAKTAAGKTKTKAKKK